MAFSSQSFTAPKIGKGNISSPLSSGASKITKAAPKLRVTRMMFQGRRTISSPALEAQSSIENTLSETNAILVEIQNQLALDFAMRIADEKEKNKTFKEEKSRKKLISKESSIESIKKIGGAIKKTASVVAAPVSGFFDKILEFITTLGLGVGANAVLTWFEDEENRRKIGIFFKIITANWKLLRNILGVIIGAGLALKVAGAIATIGTVLSFLANPIVLGFLAGAGLLLAGKAAFDLIGDAQAGGREFNAAHKVLDKKLKDAGMTVQGDVLIGNAQQRRSGKGPKGPRSEEQEKIYQSVVSGRKQLRTLQKDKDAALEGVEDDTERRKIYFTFASKIPGIVSGIETRKMGGPVIAGRPYIVGDEKGLETAEIFVPRVDGTIINNKRTQTILNGSKNKGKVNFLTMDLPPIQMNKGKPGPTPPAPEVPQISSTNSADLWRMKTPEIYGIYV